MQTIILAARLCNSCQSGGTLQDCRIRTQSGSLGLTVAMASTGQPTIAFPCTSSCKGSESASERHDSSMRLGAALDLSITMKSGLCFWKACC